MRKNPGTFGFLALTVPTLPAMEVRTPGAFRPTPLPTLPHRPPVPLGKMGVLSVVACVGRARTMPILKIVWFGNGYDFRSLLTRC